MKTSYKIQPPQWIQNPDLIIVLDVLNADALNARMVGGCIRNHLMGLDVSDIDIACTLPPTDSQYLLEKNHIRVIPTGINHGTITAHINGQNFEITTFRRDVKTDGRHAEIEFTDDWVEDAKRRDFTINALYADRDGSIYDPLGTGLNDIENKMIRFIGNPEYRIHEDYLRILRFFRFASQYGEGKPHAPSYDACKALKDNINELSDERVESELYKILSHDKANKAITWMHDCDLFGVPQKAGNHLKTLIQLQDLLGQVNINSRYITSKIDKKYIKNNKIKTFFNSTHEFINGWDGNIKKALYHYDRDVSVQALLIMKAEDHDISDFMISDAMTLPKPEFPIIAQDIMDYFKIGEGPKVGQKLKMAESIWIESDFKLSRNDILNKI
jgi:poly(A) polymerase